MNTPLDVAMQETVAFLTEWLPDGGRVLEVGCGAGHVAAELGRRGYAVIGVEANDKAVAAAREIGVEAVHATWMDYDPEDLQVDAVVFTRSLHHLHPLEEAVARIGQKVRAG